MATVHIYNVCTCTQYVKKEVSRNIKNDIQYVLIQSVRYIIIQYIVQCIWKMCFYNAGLAHSHSSNDTIYNYIYMYSTLFEGGTMYYMYCTAYKHVHVHVSTADVVCITVYSRDGAHALHMLNSCTCYSCTMAARGLWYTRVALLL